MGKSDLRPREDTRMKPKETQSPRTSEADNAEALHQAPSGTCPEHSMPQAQVFDPDLSNR